MSAVAPAPAVGWSPARTPAAGAAPAGCVDVAFDVAGTALPESYRAGLRAAVCGRLGWLAEDPGAGIHALTATTFEQGVLRLSHRTRLVLRVPAARAADALALQGSTLDIAGHALRVGAGRARSLAAFATLGAAFVAAACDTVLACEYAIAAMLEAAGLPPRFICGRMSRLATGEGELLGASVVVHELAPAQSLRLQEIGLGPHRALGCGLFVAHKTIAGID